MGNFVKLFKNHSSYDSFEEKPSVGHCINEDEVHYEISKTDYSKVYLTTEALEDGFIAFTIPDYDITEEQIEFIEYSVDNGISWERTNNSVDEVYISVPVSAGDKVLWRGKGVQTGYDGLGSFFSSDCKFTVYGNILSLIFNDDFANPDNDIRGREWVFASLFGNGYDVWSEGCMLFLLKTLFYRH